VLERLTMSRASAETGQVSYDTAQKASWKSRSSMASIYKALFRCAMGYMHRYIEQPG